jgi:hypothetical protein
VVEQWKSSRHFATYVANLGGEEVDTWTGPRACGNCHAIDAIEQRLANNLLYAGSDGPVNAGEGQLNYKNSQNDRIEEASYAGQATVASVHCTTCHDVAAATDPHLTGEDYMAGSFPLRVPAGSTDQAIIEKSSAVGQSDGTPGGNYGQGNACMWCHKSRKDVTNYISEPTNVTSPYWGPHEGPHADIFTGVGGYHYPDETYENGSHQDLENGCVDCHMPDVESNQDVGNHSFYPQLEVCQECHTNATDFDVLGGRSATEAAIQELRAVLNTAGYLTRSTSSPYEELSATQLADSAFNEDSARPASGLTAAHAGALYNYLLIARGGASGIHNPSYVTQLIFDSYFAIEDEAPQSIPIRP